MFPKLTDDKQGLEGVKIELKTHVMSSVSDRNGVHHRDHSCPDSGGVHSRHGHHHVLLLRGAAEEGEDGLEIFFKDQKSKFSLEQLMKEKTPKRTSSLQLKGLNC